MGALADRGVSTTQPFMTTNAWNVLSQIAVLSFEHLVDF